MYSSLDRIDIVLEAREDGRPVYVQSDHRTDAEIAGEPALSTLYALIRVLNPTRGPVPPEGPPHVEYIALNGAPAFLRRAVQTAGGVFHERAGGPPALRDPDLEPLDRLVQRTFAELAAAVALELGVPATLAGVQDVESRLTAGAGRSREDEIAYWAAVVKLGAFAGEVLRSSNGGNWVRADMGTLPFALRTRFRGGDATVNPLGKAIKRFESGPSDSVAALVEMVMREP